MAAFDAHAQVIVSELLRDGAPRETWRPRVDRREDRQIVEFAGREIFSAVHEFVERYLWNLVGKPIETTPAAAHHANAERELRRVAVVGGQRG